jgi:UDP-galactopyranose mutase
VGIIEQDDPIWATAQCDLPHAYVVYDHGRAAAVQQIRDWLAGYDVILSGRYSEWEYYNSDHAFLAGKAAADKVRAAENKLPEADLSGIQEMADLITRQ